VLDAGCPPRLVVTAADRPLAGETEVTGLSTGPDLATSEITTQSLKVIHCHSLFEFHTEPSPAFVDTQILQHIYQFSLTQVSISFPSVHQALILSRIPFPLYRPDQNSGFLAAFPSWTARDQSAL
jgi:hypothetical protein